VIPVLVNLAEIRKNFGLTRNYHFEEQFPPLSLMGEEITFSTPVLADVTVHNTGMVLQMKGSIRTRALLACGRCLKLVDYPIQIEFEIPYVHQDDLNEIGIQVEPGEDPDNYEIFGEQPINLRDIITENIIMAIPMSFLCHPDCRGLCVQCGQDLNQAECDCQPEQIDPRLAVLQELLKFKQE
jgi:uncharacterized protein